MFILQKATSLRKTDTDIQHTLCCQTIPKIVYYISDLLLHLIVLFKHCVFFCPYNHLSFLHLCGNNKFSNKIFRYDGKRHKAQSKEKAELQKLQHKLKKERKGALREIRRDNTFLGRVKIQQQIQRYVVFIYLFNFKRLHVIYKCT